MAHADPQHSAGLDNATQAAGLIALLRHQCPARKVLGLSATILKVYKFGTLINPNNDYLSCGRLRRDSDDSIQ